MLAAAPAEILLHDAVHDCRIRGLEMKRYRQRNIALLVEGAGVVAEFHVLTVYGPTLAIMCQQLRRFEHLGDEHGALARRCRRKEMQILPDGAADRAWDADIVLESRQSALHCLRDESRHHRAALDPEPAFVEEFQMARRVPDDEPAEAFIADEYVGAEAEHEIVDPQIPGGGDRPCQIVSRCCIVEQIGWTTDPECGVLTKRLIPLEPLRIHTIRQLPVQVRAGFHRT